MPENPPNIGEILGRIPKQELKPLPEMPKGSPEDYAPKGKVIHPQEEATLAQAIKEAMRAAPHWSVMPVGEREALDLIASEISRICAGRDYWKDIALWVTLGQEGRDAA